MAALEERVKGSEAVVEWQERTIIKYEEEQEKNAKTKQKVQSLLQRNDQLHAQVTDLQMQ